MKIYSISILDGRETILRDIVLSYNDVLSYIKDEEFKNNFIVIDSWTKRERKRKFDEERERAYLFRSLVFLNGVEILRKKELIGLDDIEQLKQELTSIIHIDGSVTYLPALPMATPEVQRIVGSKIFIMYIVKDEPQRWATFSIDTQQFGLKEMPMRNDFASDMFGKELYGDVLFVNENLVS